ncbi:NHL repeat-containing protein [Cyclobacterium plantarum]|uniref:Uncharacterized protein n=1 Tax=Cyclobacterium plantarum TaxID=2716263 RepID=A0ABX0H2U1_9BACT|nr:hypothetical protein [Cyclobacterium plantarum]NHE55812.1 hypothetical protein [Cyclobacterium plantarum]
MSFFIEMLLKVLFLFSIIPFLLSEKLQKKYDVRINPQVEYTIFSGPQKIRQIEERFMDETSGMAISQKYPGRIFVHNDSNGTPEIYVLDTLGQYLGSINLEGVQNRDWEDMAIGPGPVPGRSYLYIGDIGDNFSKHEELIVYRIPEPKDLDLKEKLSIVPEKIILIYPDGSKDAETMLVDPLSGDLYVLSKRDASNTLYKVDADQLINGDTVTLEKVMQLPITLSVGGDISADGTQIVIKNYWVVYYWTRNPGESLAETLQRQPKLLPYEPEPQGEAIAFTPDGQAYYTLSEKKLRVEPVLYRYDKVLKTD